MRRRAILWGATGLGVGYLPLAPGTWGTLVGVGYWWGLQHWLAGWTYWVAVSAGLALAVWLAGAAAKILNDPDPSCVVIDELAVLPLCLIGWGAGGWEVAAAFVIFRLFDVWKPCVIRTIQRWPGGWGIVADDVLAALATCATLHGLRWGVGLWRG